MLGIDPGSLATGWGLVSGTQARPTLVTCGVIRPGTGKLAPRLAGLHRAFVDLAREHHPAVAAVETPFTGRSSRSALLLAHARGVILAALAGAGVPVVEYTPATVKKAVAGHGRADKEQVRRMVSRLLGEPIVASRGADLSDALAVALCHTTTAGFVAALARSVRSAARP